MKKLKIVILILFVLSAAAYTVSEVSRRLTDNTPPVIAADRPLIEISVGDGEEKLLEGITASDRQDGDLTASVMVSGISKLTSADTAKVSYIVFDSDRNIGTFTRQVRYTDYRRPRFTLREPLIFAPGEDVTLNGRLFAEDVIDGDITGSIKVSARELSGGEEGIYHITVQVTNSLGDTAVATLPVIIGSRENRPTVGLTSYLVYMTTGEAFDPAACLGTVTDSLGNPADPKDVVIESSVNPDKPGSYTVTYTYTDAAGRTGTAILTVLNEEGGEAA